MIARLWLLLIAAGMIAGCAPTYEERGVGQELYSRQTPAATNNLSAYFSELCRQAHLVQSGASVTCDNYSILVQTGFNDIDQRCDHYLAWIDNKRTEAARVKSSLLAIGSRATTVLTLTQAGSNTIAYVAEALGLTGSLYDAYSNSLLMGLEGSTIKRIVYERRQEFRRQAASLNFSTTPDMVYALRSYLRICTPQTIVLDANTYAVSVASGIAAQSLESSVQQELAGIVAGQSPVIPEAPANIQPGRGKVECAECEKVFPPSGYTAERIKALQVALCVKDDGAVGPGTLAAVQHYRTTRRSDTAGTITPAEYSDILSLGCKAGDREKGISNFYEAATMRDNPGELVRLAQNLNKALPGPPQLDPATVTFASTDLRTKVAEARQLYGMSSGDAMLDTHITGALVDKIGLATLN